MANLPVKGSIGFIVFLSTFFVLSIISIVINQESSLPTYFKVFSWTLVVGMFLCVIQCITYLNRYKSLLEENIQDDEVIMFSTCPDYWTKYIGTNGTQIYTMCRNKNNKGEYVAGSLSKVTPEEGSTGYENNVLGTTIELLRGLDSTNEASTTGGNIQENFTTSSDSHVHRAERVYHPAEANGFLHTHPTQSITLASHSHPISASIPVHEGTLSNYVEICQASDGATIDDKCTNWISPGNPNDDTTSMDINLDYFNGNLDESDKCEIAKKFQWTEAINKCSSTN